MEVKSSNSIVWLLKFNYCLRLKDKCNSSFFKLKNLSLLMWKSSRTFAFSFGLKTGYIYNYSNSSLCCIYYLYYHTSHSYHVLYSLNSVGLCACETFALCLCESIVVKPIKVRLFSWFQIQAGIKYYINQIIWI